MSNERRHEDHLAQISVPTAIEAIVGYFMGETCRGCAFMATEYLYDRLTQDEQEAEFVLTSGRPLSN